MTNRIPALLLLLLACTTERAPRPAGIDSTLGDTLELPSPSVDSLASGAPTALDSLLDSLPPPVAVETIISIQPDTTIVVDSTPDTTIVVVVPTPAKGIPFGPMAAWQSGATPALHTDIFGLLAGPDSPSNIVARIERARTLGQQMMLIMTGGSHERYKTDGRFDVAKWTARQDLFCTPAIHRAIQRGVRDGTVVGAYMIDEPDNASAIAPAKSWGGVISRATLDSMADHVHRCHPTLPAGIAMNYTGVLRGDPAVFRSVDFQLSAYVTRKGEIGRYIAAATAYYDRQGLARTFTLNPLNGGFQAPRDPAAAGCPEPYTGGPGSGEETATRTCRMTPQQVREYGRALLDAGVGLVVWRYDETMMADPRYQAVFAGLRVRAATRERGAWSKRLHPVP